MDAGRVDARRAMGWTFAGQLPAALLFLLRGEVDACGFEHSQGVFQVVRADAVKQIAIKSAAMSSGRS